MCRSDLLQIDGRVVPVRVVGSTQDAIATAPLSVEPCDPADPARTPTLTLDAGRHVVSAAPGIDTGLQLDRLVLASDAGGAAGSVADGRVTDRPSAPPTPHVEVVHEGRTRVRVHVDGADEPFWLVLGQSENAGWHATTDGAALGPRRLVDGFANGWRVDPKTGSFDVVLQWTPQRGVWASIWISFAAGMACLGIIAFTWWRRRAALALVTAPDPDDVRVALEWPGADESPALAGRTQVWVPIACALAAGLIAAPWIGVLVGVVVAAALRWRAGATVPRLRARVPPRGRRRLHRVRAGAVPDAPDLRVAHRVPPGAHHGVARTGLARRGGGGRPRPAPRLQPHRERSAGPQLAWRRLPAPGAPM